jgi:hypothetical protein
VFYSQQEEERIEEVLLLLSKQFEFAERLYQYWRLSRKRVSVPVSRLPGQVSDLAMLLNVQACRQFRSIVEECRRCDAFCGGILARSLYETTLALLFVLKPHVRILLEPILDRQGQHDRDGNGVLRYRAQTSKKLKSKNYPSRELRASIYLSHAAFSNPRLFQKMSVLPGMKRFGKSSLAKLNAQTVANFEQRVGPEWAYVLRHSPFTYSGLGVVELTKVLHKALNHWYQTIYHVHSDMAHGADALRHGELRDDGSIAPVFVSPIDEVLGTLQASVALFRVCMWVCQHHIGFGTGTETALHAFSKEYEQIF